MAARVHLRGGGVASTVFVLHDQRGAVADRCRGRLRCVLPNPRRRPPGAALPALPGGGGPPPPARHRPLPQHRLDAGLRRAGMRNVAVAGQQPGASSADLGAGRGRPGWWWACTGRSNGWCARPSRPAGGGAGGLRHVRPEVKYGEGSRIDFLLQGPGAGRLLRGGEERHRGGGGAAWAGSRRVTTRGAKHPREMARWWPLATGRRWCSACSGRRGAGAPRRPHRPGLRPRPSTRPRPPASMRPCAEVSLRHRARGGWGWAGWLGLRFSTMGPSPMGTDTYFGPPAMAPRYAPCQQNRRQAVT